VEFVRGPQPANADDLHILDVDGDGRVDLTWIDAGRNAVVTMYGRGLRRFDPPVVVSPVQKGSAMAVARLLSPRFYDLVLTHASRGVVSIVGKAFQ
jgi:hypothetical protein